MQVEARVLEEGLDLAVSMSAKNVMSPGLSCGLNSICRHLACLAQLLSHRVNALQHLVNLRLLGFRLGLHGPASQQLQGASYW